LQYFTVRLPDELIRRIRFESKRRGATITSIVAKALDSRLPKIVTDHSGNHVSSR
jgi:hypothetical protein